MQTAEYLCFDLKNRRTLEVVATVTVDTEDGHLLESFWWGVAQHGYVRRNVDGGCSYLHREIMGCEKGDGMVVDHINGDKLDNRRANLRVITHARNTENRHRMEGMSRFRGVDKHAHGRWRARAAEKHLGLYDSEIEAARAVDAYRNMHMPAAQPDPQLLAYELERLQEQVAACPHCARLAA